MRVYEQFNIILSLANSRQVSVYPSFMMINVYTVQCISPFVDDKLVFMYIYYKPTL